MSKSSNELIRIAKSQYGIVTAKDVTSIGFSRVYLTRMMEPGELEKVQPGVYILPRTTLYEFAEIHFRCPKAIFSNETALFYLI